MISVYGTQGTIQNNQVNNLENNSAIGTLLSDETIHDTEGLETQYAPVYSVLSLGDGSMYNNNVSSNQMALAGQQDLLEILGYPSANNSFVLLENIPEVTLAELNLADLLDNIPNLADVLDNIPNVGDVLDNIPNVAELNLADVLDNIPNVGDVLGKVGDAVGDALDNAADAVANALDNVGDVLGNVGDAVGNILDNVGGGLGNILGNLFGKGD